MTTAAAFGSFDARMRELRDLDQILSLMNWDEETTAPTEARGPRGRQTATLEAIRHERLTSPVLGELIATLEKDPALEHDKKQMVARLRRRRDREVKVPESLVRALADARSKSLVAWAGARKDDDYAAFAPHLATMMRLSRERADALAGGGSRYDALLDEFEPGARADRIRPVLERLREGLVPMVRAIAESSHKPDDSFLRGRRWDDNRQWSFTVRLLRGLGFSLDRGRQDRSEHPFTSTLGEHDVRLTTRIHEDRPLSAIFSTIHECGHGLYEQGFDPRYHGTMLADAPSMGLHESQSRLWENQIGRSRAFWSYYLPILREHFPENLDGVSLDAFHRAVNVVEPDLIRVEADEVTYNLHILLRFELEMALLDGDLTTADLPGAWREKMKTYLGVVPKTDAEGCLQDIHWAYGLIGYFPTYSLGNLYAAQIIAAVERDRPSMWSEIERGETQHLLGWLREKIHRRGFLDSADDTVHAATGQRLAVEPFLSYLGKKAAEIYRI